MKYPVRIGAACFVAALAGCVVHVLLESWIFSLIVAFAAGTLTIMTVFTREQLQLDERFRRLVDKEFALTHIRKYWIFPFLVGVWLGMDCIYQPIRLAQQGAAYVYIKEKSVFIAIFMIVLSTLYLIGGRKTYEFLNPLEEKGGNRQATIAGLLIFGCIVGLDLLFHFYLKS